jgi:hypothetical protein
MRLRRLGIVAVLAGSVGALAFLGCYPAREQLPEWVYEPPPATGTRDTNPPSTPPLPREPKVAVCTGADGGELACAAGQVCDDDANDAGDGGALAPRCRAGAGDEPCGTISCAGNCVCLREDSCTCDGTWSCATIARRPIEMQHFCTSAPVDTPRLCIWRQASSDAGTEQTCAFVNGSYFVFEDSAEAARHAGADSGWELHVGPSDIYDPNRLQPAHIAGCDRIFASAPAHIVACDEPADAAAD